MYCYKCGKYDEHNSNFCRNCAAPMFRYDGKLKKINTNVRGKYSSLEKVVINNETAGKDHTIIMNKQSIKKDGSKVKGKIKAIKMTELFNKLRENYKKEIIIALSLIVTIMVVFIGIKLIENPGRETSTVSEDQSNSQSSQESSIKINNKGPNGYVLINTDKEKLSEEEIEDLELCYLMIARNEIYARHGYIFKDPQLKKYFESKDWYKKDRSFKGSIKSTIEQHNISLIKEAESKKKQALENGNKLTEEEALNSLLQNTNLKLKDESASNKGKIHKYFDEFFYKYPSEYFSEQEEKVDYLVSQSTGKVYVYTKDGDFYAYK